MTPLQKIKLLKQVRIKIENDEKMGICEVLYEYNYDVFFPYDAFHRLLPELYTLRPKKYFLYWFPLTKNGQNKRINLIDKAITIIEDKLNTKKSPLILPNKVTSNNKNKPKPPKLKK